MFTYTWTLVELDIVSVLAAPAWLQVHEWRWRTLEEWDEQDA